MEKFAEMGLSDIMLKALEAKGFEEPSPIQMLTIQPLLENRCDLIAQAQTGTGKTAAYGIPIIEALDVSEKKQKAPRALVLAPTRELAMQIAAELDSLNGARTLRHVAVFGGQFIELQLRELRSGCDVVVGTPGRVIDLLERGALDFSQLRFAVLDEADEMLNMGFIEDIERILSATPEEKRMLMFSATMPAEIRRIAEQFMHNAEYVAAVPARLDTGSIEQIAYEVRREDKQNALERIIAASNDLYAMVFCRTRSDVDELTSALRRRNFAVEALHGELPQSQRTRIIGRFKEKEFKILIATDVAARGIDVDDLNCVINYSIPQSPDIYVHRIGRTGRAGRSGLALTLVTPGEHRMLQRIRREAKTKLVFQPLPDAAAIVEAKKRYFEEELLSKLLNVSPEYHDFAEELLQQTDSPAALVGTLLEMRFGKALSPESYPSIGSKSAGEKSAESAPVTLQLGLGRADGYGPGEILDLLCEETKVWKSKVGKISCQARKSTVEVNADAANVILRFFRNTDLPIRMLEKKSDSGRSEQRERDGGYTSRRERGGERSERRSGRPERSERSERPARAPRKAPDAKRPVPPLSAAEMMARAEADAARMMENYTPDNAPKKKAHKKSAGKH